MNRRHIETCRDFDRAGVTAAELARLRELARLLPLWPHEIEDRSVDGRVRLLAIIGRSLRAERRRGLAGHWSYDLARHAALLKIYRVERAALNRDDGRSGSERRGNIRFPPLGRSYPPPHIDNDTGRSAS